MFRPHWTRGHVCDGHPAVQRRLNPTKVGKKQGCSGTACGVPRCPKHVRVADGGCAAMRPSFHECLASSSREHPKLRLIVWTTFKDFARTAIGLAVTMNWIGQSLNSLLYHARQMRSGESQARTTADASLVKPAPLRLNLNSPIAGDLLIQYRCCSDCDSLRLPASTFPCGAPCLTS